MFLIQGEVDGSNEPFHVHFPVVSIGVIQWLQQTISQNKTSCTVSILPWSIGTKDNWRSAMFSQGICWLPYPHQLEHDVFFDVFCWPAWWTWSECMPRSTPGAEQKTSGWRRGRWLPAWIIPEKKSFARIIRSPSVCVVGLFVELSFISFHQLVQPLHLVVLGWKKQISNPVSSPTGLYKHLESCLKLSNLAMPLHSLSVLSSWSIAAVCLVAHAGIQQRKGRLPLHLEASNQQSCHMKLHTQLLLG